VGGLPIVEGVAADDYDVSACLVSPLKAADKTLIRRFEDVPTQYRVLPLVDHRAEIEAPYSRDAVAVKLAEDDLLGWATYALAKSEVLQQRHVARGQPTSLAPATHTAAAGTTAAVVKVLLARSCAVATKTREVSPCRLVHHTDTRSWLRR